MPRTVQDRGRNPELVEPQAFRGLEVESARLKRKVAQQAREDSPAHAYALETAVMPLLGKNAVVWVIRDRTFRNRSQVRCVAEMIGMNVRVKNERQIA